MVEQIKIDEENPELSFDLNSIGIAGNILRYEEGMYLEVQESMIPITRSTFTPNVKYTDPIDGEVIELAIRSDQYMKIMEIFDLIETNKDGNRGAAQEAIRP